MDTVPSEDEKPERIERKYYADGTLQEEIHYRGASPHGPWRTWHPNGVLAGEWWLDKGVYLNCTNRAWYPSGQLQVVWTYDSKGYLVEMLAYAEDGRLLPTLSDEQRKTLKKMVAKAKAAKPRPSRRRDPDAEAALRRQVDELLSSRTVDAKEWLGATSNASKRNLGEMNTEISVEFVDALYELGAATVLAAKVEGVTGRGDETSDHLLVRPAAESDARAHLFAFAAAHTRERGFDPDPDFGQEYIWLWLC